MITYIDANGKQQKTSTLKPNFKNVIEPLYESIINAGYECRISIKKDKAIRPTENNKYYVFFAIDGNTPETKSLGIRLNLGCRAFKQGYLSEDKIQINKNCSWSPKPLYV